MAIQVPSPLTKGQKARMRGCHSTVTTESAHPLFPEPSTTSRPIENHLQMDANKPPDKLSVFIVFPKCEDLYSRFSPRDTPLINEQFEVCLMDRFARSPGTRPRAECYKDVPTPSSPFITDPPSWPSPFGQRRRNLFAILREIP